MVYDAIVVGLGAVGSAALYQLSKQTSHVLGIDRFKPPHPFGSTHSDSRITRQAIGEGAYFVPLALRSYEIWRELEQRTNQQLLTITGGLFVGKEHSRIQTHNKPGWLTTTIEAAKQFGIAHQLLDVPTLRKRFPQFQFLDGDLGYYEENAGFLRPEQCLSAQLTQAHQNGAIIHPYEQMLSFEQTGPEIRVQTDEAVYQTRKLILTTGPWITESLRTTPYRELLKVYRQVQYWFDIQGDYPTYTPDRMPVFILSDRDLYGFPAIGGADGGIKIATEQYSEITTPNDVVRTVSQAEIEQMYEQYVAPNFVGVGPECVKSTVCLYTMTPNGDFIIDQHPDYANVLLTSACSGHGFKHSAAVGQILAELALQGKTNFDIQAFRLQSFSGLIN
ncbi:N-methyl-L-tryptophan oxidase [Spirosoma endophyticum]|uniref:Sarcosine oxidase n=1 Tax=Spirosoma endophyticum TaxID=662367 RepID=A0A1I1VA36_9BACT|nr:N-methyl-L-tryptophan oxidase [Spirosoma endophyticum]SFD77953.1 sarcosine oxidase [Spirosoma endophyticum]